MVSTTHAVPGLGRSEIQSIAHWDWHSPTAFRHAIADKMLRGLPAAFQRRWTQIGNIWTVRQKVTLQELCVALAVFSVVLTILTAYWFCRMRKRFRHK